MLKAEDHDELRSLAEMAVYKGWRECRRADPAANPDEVDQTYRLMRWTTRYLAALWKPVFERRRVPMRMSGVFCHKTPMATFDDEHGDKKTCELGDLLVVHDHLGREPFRRAALMQAKRTLRGTAKAPDDVQNDLYRRLPEFRLSRQGHKGSRLKAGPRDIGHAADFARFALVADDASHCRWPHDNDWPFPCYSHGGSWRPAWVVGHPKQDPVTSLGAETFGSFLTSMLYETHPSRGQTIKAVPDLAAVSLGTGQDLDITVQELLDVTAERIAKSKEKWGGLHRGIMAFQEGSLPMTNPGSPLLDLPSLPGSEEEPPGGAGEPDEDDGDGISILLIETFSD